MVPQKTLELKNECEKDPKTLTFQGVTGIITKLYAQGDFGVQIKNL